VGGYVGAAWQSRDVNAWDPVAAGGALPAGTFYHPNANNADGGNFNYNLGGSPTGGGTVGCNWQGNWPIVLGAEADGGYMKVAASAVVPYSVFTGNDAKSETRIGRWDATLAGRAGLAWDRLLVYVKVGVGFANLHASYTDVCATAPCTPSTLIAHGTSRQPFWIGGAGLEYALTNEWSVKGEALVLGMYKLFSVCGPGGGAAAGTTFCGRYNIEGVHTLKIGANYHFNAPAVAKY
jgi:outer membrane immunogenic protein